MRRFNFLSYHSSRHQFGLGNSLEFDRSHDGRMGNSLVQIHSRDSLSSPSNPACYFRRVEFWRSSCLQINSWWTMVDTRFGLQQQCRYWSDSRLWQPNRRSLCNRLVCEHSSRLWLHIMWTFLPSGNHRYWSGTNHFSSYNDAQWDNAWRPWRRWITRYGPSQLLNSFKRFLRRFGCWCNCSRQ